MGYSPLYPFQQLNNQEEANADLVTKFEGIENGLHYLFRSRSGNKRQRVSM